MQVKILRKYGQFEAGKVVKVEDNVGHFLVDNQIANLISSEKKEPCKDPDCKDCEDCKGKKKKRNAKKNTSIKIEDEVKPKRKYTKKKKPTNKKG